MKKLIITLTLLMACCEMADAQLIVASRGVTTRHRKEREKTPKDEFVKDNKITVKDYIHTKVMAQAEQLLIYSEVPISDISEALGFCEVSYFTKWFRKKKNCTPSEYRKNMRSGFRIM